MNRQSFLKPSVTKEPKPTFALEYSFARKKVASAPPGAVQPKSLAHIWELGGDIYEPGLLEIPISLKTFTNASVIIVIDLSKPQNVLKSLLKWIDAIRDVISRRIKELASADNTAAQDIRNAAMQPYAENSDAARVRPCEIPLFIVATKWDALKSKSMTSADRKAIMQALRFVAHYNGASLYSTSSTESVLKESFRGIMGSICFRTPLKTYTETSPDKPIYVSAGTDNFEDILLGENASDLLRSEAELADYISDSGIARKCWDRFDNFHSSIFGPPDLLGSMNNLVESKIDDEGGGTDEGDNEYPEAEIDAIRAEKDVQLQQYILEADRKEQLLKKMYSDVPLPAKAVSTGSRNKENGGNENENQEIAESKRGDEGFGGVIDGENNDGNGERKYSEGKNSRK